MINDRAVQLLVAKSYKADALVKVSKIPIEHALSDSEVVTDFVFPEKCMILAVGLDITTKEDTGTTKTIIVGNETDDNGFMNAASVATAGLVKPLYADGAETVGVLLYETEGAGAMIPCNDITSGGEHLCWTPASANFAELEGFIIVTYIDLT